MVTDKKGNLRGSFFIDAPNVAGNVKFKTGTKLFSLLTHLPIVRWLGVR